MGHRKETYLAYGINFKWGTNTEYWYDFPKKFTDSYLFDELCKADGDDLKIIYDCNGNMFFGKVLKHIEENDEVFATPIHFDENRLSDWRYFFCSVCKLFGIKVRPHDIRLLIIQAWV